MVKTATVAELQYQRDQAGFDANTDDVQTANPFAGLRIDVGLDVEWGMAMHKVRTALLDAGRVASEEQIRAETARLWGPAADPTAKPRTAGQLADQVEAAMSDALAGEIPGMPPKPAPKAVLRVPAESEFGEDGEEFFISSALKVRAAVLQDRHPDLFEHLDGMSVTYLWKRAGGKSKGAPTFGKCTKPSGLLKLFSESTFVVWLAADHCRGAYYGDPEIEQLLFHEMLHTAVGEPDEETGRGGGPVLVPHQLEIFDAEIEVYGLAGIALREAAPLFRQAVYDGDADDRERRANMQAVIDSDEGMRGSWSDADGAGVLIHDDGTPLTAEEIAEQEAAELRDDPAEDDDSDLPV